MSKTTLDLSTLSDIADGVHTVTVKAKASRYNDSEFSNEVSYTKASVQYITFSLTSTRGNDDDRSYSYSTFVQMTTNDGVKTGSLYYDQLQIDGVAVDKPITITALSTVKLYTQYTGDWIGYYINNTLHEQRGGDVNSPIEVTLNDGDELKIIWYMGFDG